MFSNIPPYPGDPVLSLVEEFVKDPRSEKINLSIGLYYDNEGKVPLLQAVEKAEEIYFKQNNPRPYLPMDGSPAFREGARKFFFGAEHPALQENRVASIQTIGGSGALSLTAAFMKRHFPESVIWISDPTWDNHRTIFEAVGLTVKAYPYYDTATQQLDFEGLKACIASAPEKSLFLLHPCCHNPTGRDLSNEQWLELVTLFKSRNLMAYHDIAYQGLAKGLAEDAWVVHQFIDAHIPTWIGASFSKNLSFYGERAGLLHVVCENNHTADIVLGQLKAAVRQLYSSPPTHGAAIAAIVLNTPELLTLWKSEVEQMCTRIRTMRATLQKKLSAEVKDRDFSYFTTQQGMFSYTGLNPEQVQRLKEEFAIYLVGTGRLCIAGLNDKNIDYVAQSIAKVIRS